MTSKAIFGVVFGAQQTKEVGSVYTAETAGFVIATITSGGENPPIHGIIEGCAGKTKNPKRQRAYASMQYAGEFKDGKSYIPRSSFLMPVSKGENWIVRGISGNVKYAEVFWMSVK